MKIGGEFGFDVLQGFTHKMGESSIKAAHF